MNDKVIQIVPYPTNSKGGVVTYARQDIRHQRNQSDNNNMVGSRKIFDNG